MLGGCLRRLSPRRRSPLHLSDWACQCDRTPLVWQIQTRRQCIQLPGELAKARLDLGSRGRLEPTGFFPMLNIGRVVEHPSTLARRLDELRADALDAPIFECTRRDANTRRSCSGIEEIVHLPSHQPDHRDVAWPSMGMVEHEWRHCHEQLRPEFAFRGEKSV